MEDRPNYDWEDVVKIAETFPWEPSFNKVVITLNREEPDGVIVYSDNELSEEQFIIAVGPHVRNYLPCDLVILDLDKLVVRTPNPTNQDEVITQVKIDPIFDDEGNQFMIIEDRFIKARRNTNQPLQSNE